MHNLILWSGIICCLTVVGIPLGAILILISAFIPDKEDRRQSRVLKELDKDIPLSMNGLECPNRDCKYFDEDEDNNCISLKYHKHIHLCEKN